MKTTRTLALVGLTALALAGCSAGADEHAGHEVHATSTTSASNTPAPTSASPTASTTGMAGHDMHQMSTLPTGLVADPAPKYPVGTPVTILTDHMAGMKGAKGTVSGAYRTTLYAVSYTPTTGGEPVTKHRWVSAEELTPRPAKPLARGTTVTLDAEHMAGMKGAKATVDEALAGTGYVVDYTPTDGSAMVHGHLWVSADELAKA